MVIGLLASLLSAAPRWSPGRRRALRLFLLLLALGLTIHNGRLLWVIGSIIPLPPGFHALVS
jgi:hypothetical protein